MLTSKSSERIAHEVRAFGLTDRGRVREVNEDQFLIARLRKTLDLQATSLPEPAVFDMLQRADAHLLLIADGVGGVRGGKEASGTAVETVAQFVAHATGCFYDGGVDQEHEFLDRLEDAVHRCHEEVQRGHQGPGQGPATTLTMVNLLWPRAYIVHIGDSRCYYLRDGRLRLLTEDQTVGRALVDQGVMTEAQVAKGGWDHVLSSAIGAEITPSIGLIDLDPDDTLLLCTDGLTKHVSDERIAELLGRDDDPETLCRVLVDEALAGGGSDNVTVVIAK